MVNPEKKKSRNIGSKSKRLLIHSEDAVELRITWEEAQELLRPAPSAKPTIVMVDNHEFEEYDVSIYPTMSGGGTPVGPMLAGDPKSFFSYYLV